MGAPRPDAIERASRVRLMLFDVDGVLTDGTVTMGDGREVKRVPGQAQIESMQQRYPDARLMLYLKRGASLAREMKWLGSYRYAVLNLGGASPVLAGLDFGNSAGYTIAQGSGGTLHLANGAAGNIAKSARTKAHHDLHRSRRELLRRGRAEAS